MIDVSNFHRLGNNLFMCFEDNEVLKIAQKLKIENELLASMKSDTDFITAILNSNSNTHCDLIVFFYAGSLSDSGFMCFILTNFIKEQLNINELLKKLKDMSQLLQISDFKNYIVEIVYQHYKQYPEIKLNHYLDDDNLIFSLSQ